jgi:hypothetical protein
MRLFVLDTGALWIRCFLRAMPREVQISGFRIFNPLSLLRRSNSQGRPAGCEAQWQERQVPVPSWHRLFSCSSLFVNLAVRLEIVRSGPPDAVLFTLPWYATVAEKLGGCKRAYYAHDTFRYYGWDPNIVISLETRLLNACDFGMAVARAVADDLRECSQRPVHYFPMATSWLPRPPSAADGPIPEDLAAIPSPRAGCVGQISRAAYDWDLIEHLSLSLPSVNFVFVGPMFDDVKSSEQARRVFRRHNVHWLGAKSHDSLPAYFSHFDVCLNLLRISDHNNRRSPLRLYDYLTTRRPVISTAIAEAHEHAPHIDIAFTREEFAALMRSAIANPKNVDLAARRAYIEANTWTSRAAQFLNLITAVVPVGDQKPDC